MNSKHNSKGEHYNLRWNNYFTNLVQVFTELQQKEQMVDVTLVCEGQQLKAHKIILSACSGFFMDLFQTLEERQPVLIFHEMKFSHLNHIINFLYQGEVKVLDVDLEGVLVLGEKFQVKGLSSVKLKHKESPTSDANLCNHKEDAVKYELRSSYKAFPIITPEAPSENMHKKINSNGSTAKVKNKNKITEEQNGRPPKKLKTGECVSPVILNRSMIKERVDGPKSKTAKAEIRETKSKNTEKSQPIETNIQIKTEETIDLSDDDSSSHNPRETSLINNEKFSIAATTKLPESHTKIDKPINAFLIFSKEWRKKVKLEHPNEDYKSVSLRLGKMWKNLTSEVRESYYAAARQEQLNFQNKIQEKHEYILKIHK